MENENTLKIEIWSDIMCPFCYIGKRKIEAALAEFPNRDAIEIEWKSFQLDPTTTSQPGVSSTDYLAKRYGRDRSWAEEMHNNVASQAQQVGLEYHLDKTVIANSFDAHRLSHLAKKHNLGNVLEELIFNAYFKLGKDLADHGTLTELGLEAGLPLTEIQAVLSSDQYGDAVKADIAEAQQIGVKGVPFFVFDRKYAISGAQPTHLFTETLEKAWADKTAQ